MDRKGRALRIKNFLDHYFPDPEIPLKHTDPYTLLIAVVLSARSTDAMVNRITPTLFKRAKNPSEMILLTVEEIQSLIRPCGLSPQKAKAILGLSKIILDKHSGEVPQSFEALEALPGVGHKTASVVMAQAFNVPAFPVDTHIFRCARRWGLSHGKTVKAVEADLKNIFDKEDWIKLHLQIIYYARAFCRSRNHRIEECPICQAFINKL